MRMTIETKIKLHSYAVNCFKEFPCYKKHIEKLKIERLKNVDLLTELPFYKGLNKIKADHAFKGYAQTFRVEIVDRKNPICQSNASKLAIKALFSDLLNETKGFRYQITMKILLKKYKISEIEFAPAYFNSTMKTVINYKTGLEDSFQEILYRIGNWINKGSG